MISQREISKIAFRQHKLDKIIEKDYVISWILLGLAGSRLKKSFAFKGGTALKKVYFPDYRYSEDLDFTLLGDLEEKVLIDGFRAVWNGIAYVLDILIFQTEPHMETLSRIMEK